MNMNKFALDCLECYSDRVRDFLYDGDEKIDHTKDEYEEFLEELLYDLSEDYNDLRKGLGLLNE